MRSTKEICEEIADATPEEQGRIIAQIRSMDIPEDVKQMRITFVMFLSTLGQRSSRDPIRRRGH